MAHHQSKPAHDSDAQHEKNSQTGDAKSAATGGSHRSPEKKATYVDNTPAHGPGEEASHEFLIMGFPWQFAVVVGIIVGSVLIIVLKAMGLF